MLLFLKELWNNSFSHSFYFSWTFLQILSYNGCMECPINLQNSQQLCFFSLPSLENKLKTDNYKKIFDTICENFQRNKEEIRKWVKIDQKHLMDIAPIKQCAKFYFTQNMF